MKAITLYQPWASLVALGHKPHETRSWPTSYRGSLLIHAGKRWDRELERLWTEFDTVLRARGLARLPSPNMPIGAVVALATLRDCYPTRGGLGVNSRDDLDERFGDWSASRWAWSLCDIRPLPEPIPWSGSQGLWGVPDALAAKVRAALVEATAS